MSRGRVVGVSNAVDQGSGGLARRPAVATALVAGTVFVLLAAFLVPWDWIPGGTLSPAGPSDVFTSAEIGRAEEYSTVRRYLGWSSYFLSLLLALFLGLTPWGTRLLRRSTRRLRWWLAVPVAAALLLAVGRLVTLPISLGIRSRDLDYGLTKQPLGEWALDYGGSFLVATVATSILMLVVVGTARRSPRYWFAWGGGVAAAVTVGASFLYPVVVEPLFNNFTSMQPGAFKSSVFELADAEGVHIDDVLVSDASRRTTTLNAYVSGFGSTRRVVVYDNLLNDLTSEEARVVIAHELAHAKHNDVLLGTTLGAVGSVFGISVLALLLDGRWVRRRSGASSPADPAVVAVVLALTAAGTLLASPLENTISRAIEVRADRDSIAATGQGDVFSDMQHELAVHSLSDPTPPHLNHIWFGSHPTVLERAGIPASLEDAAE